MNACLNCLCIEVGKTHYFANNDCANAGSKEILCMYQFDCLNGFDNL